MAGLFLGVFFGWAGGYRFYKKQIGLGILYLFTFGLFGIGWIIDAVLAVREYKPPKFPVKDSKPEPVQNTVVNDMPSYMKLDRNLYTEPKTKYTPNIAHQKHFIVYDFETTGIDPHYCEIIEIGALKIADGEIVDRFQSLVKPAYPIPADATRVNHITNEMVQNAPTAEEIIPSFLDFIGDSKMMGYNNARYDHIILRRYAMAICGKSMDNLITDVYSLCRKKLDLNKYTLSDVAKYFNIDTSNAHRSIGDCETTFECFKRLQAIYQTELQEKKQAKNED